MDAVKTAATSHRRRLYAAIEARPEGVIGDIMNGGLYVQPRPGARHVVAGSRL